MDSPLHNFCSKTQTCEGESVAADPRGATSEDVRETFNTIEHKPAHGNRTCLLECLDHGVTVRTSSEPETLTLDVAKRLEQVEKEMRRYDSLEARLQHLERSAFPGCISQKQFQEKAAECEKLKEKIRLLETRNQELLSKLVSTHKHSENMSDPSRLSAVLEMYEILRLHHWEKFKNHSAHMSYPMGRDIIKMLKNGLQHANSSMKQFISQKVFDSCEAVIEKRKKHIFEELDIPSSDYAANSLKQELMPELLKLFRKSCHSGIYSKIIEKVRVLPKTHALNEFAEQCCEVYCLLLLQDSPVKAMWDTRNYSPQDLEHVDMKNPEHWKKPELLWPIMTCGDQVIVKGVVWDEK